MRASLSLNPESFTRRFAAIPCAAGSAFQAVDVLMNTPLHQTNFDWGTMFVKPSQHGPGDDDDGNVTRCRNCRFKTTFWFRFCQMSWCVRSLVPALQPFHSTRRCGSGFLLYIGTVTLRGLTSSAATRFAFEDGY
jgi:hypothetical protein